MLAASTRTGSSRRCRPDATAEASAAAIGTLIMLAGESGAKGARVAAGPAFGATGARTMDGALRPAASAAAAMKPEPTGVRLRK